MHTTGIGLGDPPGLCDAPSLGGKGAGLVEMVRLGLPVPPGFVIGTACGRAYLAEGALPDGLDAELAMRVAALEALAGRRFGDDADPLLVSVRSGAPVSMPGMMDTVLNVGLTMTGAELLAGRSGDARFAWTSMERLLDSFARTVRGVGVGLLEDVLLDVASDSDPARAARARCAAILALIESESGAPFPDAAGQLHESIEAVFSSWRSARARAYRAHKGIHENLGTAVVVQTMVFGNRDADSGSGVAFTRDPSTGARGVYGDFLFLAQGEDVVCGERDTDPLPVIGERLPAVYAQLGEVLTALERHARDLCDVEFTIESGRLYVLQTRVGQRSGRAAVTLAVDLVDEGLITVAEAVARVSADQLRAAAGPRFSGDPAPGELLAVGLAASPGAVCGVAAFDSTRAQHLAEHGAAVVLLRPTTSPVDLPGVLAAVGVVTGRGGRTSHAAVVARGLDRPAVCGVGELRVAPDGRSADLGAHHLSEGEEISVDGDRGVVSRGRRTPVPAAEADSTLARFLSWHSEFASLPDPVLSAIGKLMSTVSRPKPTVFTASDDLLHDEYSTFGPHARESIIITAPIPGEELLVFAYLWREGGTKWGRFVFVGGPEMAKAEFCDFNADGVYSGDNLRDFEVSGLHWRQPEPLKTAEVTYTSDDLDLVLRFEAIHEPFSWHDNPGGCPEWVAHDRYEQCGKTQVKMNLRGREIEFSGVGHRDHSWGTRNWNYLQHWKWMNCATLDGTASLHCMLMQVQGEILVNGYLNVGGVVSPIVTGEAKADLDESMYHRHVAGHFVDELGREMSMDCHFAAGWSMPIGHLYLNEVGMHATLDGAPAIAHVELGWPKDYVDALTGGT